MPRDRTGWNGMELNGTDGMGWDETGRINERMNDLIRAAMVFSFKKRTN